MKSDFYIRIFYAIFDVVPFQPTRLEENNLRMRTTYGALFGNGDLKHSCVDVSAGFLFRWLVGHFPGIVTHRTAFSGCGPARMLRAARWKKWMSCILLVHEK